MALAKSPTLIDLVKKNEICLECCPVSNRILGYCSDLRCHPVRGLIAKGVKVSINPDDQGFFDAKGVTLDYLLVYLAWGLDLADLKQLCLSSLEYASISEESEDYRKDMKEFFNYKWKKFLIAIKGRF